jgi:hypothetical protein
MMDVLVLPDPRLLGGESDIESLRIPICAVTAEKMWKPDVCHRSSRG